MYILDLLAVHTSSNLLRCFSWYWYQALKAVLLPGWITRSKHQLSAQLDFLLCKLFQTKSVSVILKGLWILSLGKYLAPGEVNSSRWLGKHMIWYSSEPWQRAIKLILHKRTTTCTINQSHGCPWTFVFALKIKKWMKYTRSMFNDFAKTRRLVFAGRN